MNSFHRQLKIKISSGIKFRRAIKLSSYSTIQYNDYYRKLENLFPARCCGTSGTDLQDKHLRGILSP